jgi:hypothetical protein
LPHYGRYLERMLEREAVKRVIGTEKLAAPLV